MIGKQIYQIRKSKGLTQQALCDLTGLTKDRLSEIENDKANITLSTLYKICQALDCKIELPHPQLP